MTERYLGMDIKKSLTFLHVRMEVSLDQHTIQKVISCIRNPSTVLWCTGLRWHWGIFALLLALALGIRLLLVVAVPLIPEEAYYWMYAQHAELSYFDHPPMVAWVIGLGTAVFGNTEFGVRIAGNLLMLGASLLMYLFGRAWFSQAAGTVAYFSLYDVETIFIVNGDPALIYSFLNSMIDRFRQPCEITNGNALITLTTTGEEASTRVNKHQPNSVGRKQSTSICCIEK